MTAAAGHHEKGGRAEGAAAASHYRLYGDWREHSGSIRPSLEQVRQEYRGLHPEAKLDVATIASLNDSYADQLSSDEEIEFTPLTWQEQEELDERIRKTVELATQEHNRRHLNCRIVTGCQTRTARQMMLQKAKLIFNLLTLQEQRCLQPYKGDN